MSIGDYLMTLLMLTLSALRTHGLDRTDGQTMAEYGILVAAIAVVVIVAATVFGGNLSGLFSSSAHRV